MTTTVEISQIPINKNSTVINKIPYYSISIYQRTDISSIPNFDRKYKAGYGLCNQLFVLINNIIQCMLQKKSYCIIDSFNSCINKNSICQISKIFNLESTTKNINKLCGFEDIKLFDRTNFNIDIINAEYGIFHIKTINVTESLRKVDEIANISMNDLFGDDPCPKIHKLLYVKYMINNITFDTIIKENCQDLKYIFNKDFICGNLFSGNRADFSWYDTINESIFLSIFRELRFTDGFYNIINEIKEKYIIDEKINIIHFRLEEDAINHWAGINKMNVYEFEKKIYEKYTYLIKKYIADEEKIYILSSDEKSISEKFYSIGKFVYAGIDIKSELLMKYYGISGRELSAIIDLLIGIKYSKLFIGCHSYEYTRGSTFSYMIARNINCKTILFDVEDINSPENVYS